MNIIWAGYIFAIISSMFSAIYVVPKKFSKQKPNTYAMVMGVGYFITAGMGFMLLTAFNFIDEPLFFPEVIIACINGVVWTVGSVSVLNAIDRIGLAKSNQWKSLQGPIGAVLMLIILSEFLTTNVLFIILAAVFITLAAMMVSTREKDNRPTDKAGIAYALNAALFYGIAALLNKYLTDQGMLFAQQLYKALFIFISAGVYTLVKYKGIKIEGASIKKEIALPLTGGLLYFGNATFSILAYSLIDGSIAFMMHQLNAIWLFFLGVFLFREIDFKKYSRRLVIGLVCSAIGVVMLVLAGA